MMPALGWVADHHGLHAAIWVVALLPVVCTGLTLALLGLKAPSRETVTA
jgi:hypothetical protein